MQEKPTIKIQLPYRQIPDNSFESSNLCENLEEIKDESSISELFSQRSPIELIQNTQNSLEMITLKPLKNNEDLVLAKNRLNSVIEEVEEEDLTVHPNDLTLEKINDKTDKNDEINENGKNDKSLERTSSKVNYIMSNSLRKHSFIEKGSVRYNMSPSIANNSLIAKPDIKIHGLNFKESSQKSPKNNEWLSKRERSSLRGLGGLMINNHLAFLKINSNIKDSLLPLIKSIVFVIVDALQAILSIFSCILYILDCYVSANDTETLHFLHIAELVITLIFTFDLLRHFIESKTKLQFFMKIHTIIDLLAILPYFISLMFPLENSLNFLHILQIFRLIRILRLYRLFNDPDLEGSDAINDIRFSLERQFSIFLCTIFATLFIFSGISYEFNGIFEGSYIVKIYDETLKIFISSEKSEDYTFFYAFYFFYETFLTVGYGDVMPNKPESRILVSLIIIIFSLILIDQLYKLYDVKSKISPYDFDYKHTEHLVIIGFFTENSVQRMLLDLFRDELFDKYILIIRNSPPSEEMLILIDKFNTQKNEIIISYLQSFFMKDDIILKANINHAKAILLMNDPNLFHNDNEILMLLKLFQDYNGFIRKIVQINENNDIWNDSQLSNPWNIVFSPCEIKTNLLCMSVFNKGIITLFNNLMNSLEILPPIRTNLECQWLMEYSASILQSVFLVYFSDFFIGKKFRETAVILYQAKSKFDYLKGMLLIGVKTFANIEQNKGNVYMNPQNYTIKQGDYAIIIAKNKETADFVSFFKEEAENFAESIVELKIELFPNENEEWFSNS